VKAELQAQGRRLQAVAMAEITLLARARIAEGQLSKIWETLAIELENAFAQLAETEDIGANVREALNEARRLSDE
jgi:hypothetical protein